MLDLIYILLACIYIGTGLIIIMKLNPEQALKLVSGKLPALIITQIRNLFKDKEFVQDTFGVRDQQLEEMMVRVMDERMEVAQEGIKRTIIEELVQTDREIKESQKTLLDDIVMNVQNIIREQLAETELPIPEDLGVYITSVLTSWLDARQAEATKAQTKAPPGQPAMIPQGQGEMVDVVIQAITQYNPLAGQLLAKARANNGGRPSRNSGSSNYNNRGY